MAESPATVDYTNFRATMYDVKWNSQAMGGLDMVDVTKIKWLLRAVRVGSLGPIKLDDRFLGLTDDSVLPVVVREVTRAMIEKLVPWSGTTGTEFAFTPPLGTLIADTYGKALILHPRDKTDTSEDIELYMTVPIHAVAIPHGDNQKDTTWEVIFNIYPDPAKITAGTNPYGRMKAAAA